MPHLKCEACRARVRYASDAAGQLCPLCGAPLEPVASLSEIVGFRVVVASTPPGGTSAAGHRRLADEVAKIVARRRAAEARSWSEVNRWAP